jgi:addiction module HigA family antidote
VHLEIELNELNMTAVDFAEKLHVPSDRLLAILAGEERVNAEFALRLAHYFGTSALFWLNLQTSFDLEEAEKRVGAEIQGLDTLQAAAA